MFNANQPSQSSRIRPFIELLISLVIIIPFYQKLKYKLILTIFIEKFASFVK